MVSELYAGVDYGKRKLAIALTFFRRGQPRTAFFDYDWPKPTSKRALAEHGPEQEADHLVLQESTASGIFSTHRPTLVAVERPLTSKLGGDSIMALNQVSGVLALAARNAGCPVLYVASNSWKKVVCGHGGFDKEQVARWVRERYPHVYEAAPSQDSLDAFCLSIAARMEAEASLVGDDHVL